MATKIIACLTVLSLCATLALCQQPDCSRLDVNFTGDAVSGSDLPVCSTEQLQCCTREYVLMLRDRISRRLQDGLREQISERIEDFDDVVDDISEYFSSTFGNELMQHLPISPFIDIETIVGDLIGYLEDNIVIQNDAALNFSVTQIIREILGRLDAAAGEALGLGNPTTAACISQVIQENTDEDLVQQIIEDITQIRFAVTSIRRMLDYYGMFNRTLVGFELAEQCLTAFIERGLCARCRQDIPPFCGNVCGGIVRGCFSPVFNGLQAQFNIMWRVGRQLVVRINERLGTLYTQENTVIDLPAIVGQLTSDCGVMIPGVGRKKRQTPPGLELLEDSILDRMEEFDGVFDYEDDDGGPRVCRPRRVGDDCDPDEEFCIATTNCWDGERMRDQDAVPFLVATIRGQRNNPYAEFDEDALIAQARELGTPVSEFLEFSAFSSGMPEGIVVPEGEVFNGRGSIVVFSLAVCILAVAAALFFN